MFEFIKKISNYKWLIPKENFEGMRVDGLIFASENILKHIEQEETYKQVINVAFLPGIEKYSIGMPDIHWGYGFPIGGVAAINENGVVSPGGVGSDINCGVRTLLTPLNYNDIQNKKEEILNEIYNNVPAGVGVKGKLKISKSELENVVKEGAKWAVKNNLGLEEDLESIEDYGALPSASLDYVSRTAIERGLPQLGTLGSGNHFLEIQRCTEIYDKEIAQKFGIFENQLAIMIHTGSRGFGHQICEDYIQIMQSVMDRYKIKLPDRQLASAPIDSKEGKQYLSAMASAANYAFCNREIISHYVREAFNKIFKLKISDLKLLYDVAHNIAKFEFHNLNGKKVKLLVHRKGATRAFPANHPILPEKYKETGQPVIIPGDMGTASYILVGLETSLSESFGTVCHGAGRVLSRHKAKKIANKEKIYSEFEKKGIVLKAPSWSSIAEEIPEAYKDIDEVVEVVTNSGLAKKVAKFVPIAVMKG